MTRTRKGSADTVSSSGTSKKRDKVAKEKKGKFILAGIMALPTFKLLISVMLLKSLIKWCQKSSLICCSHTPAVSITETSSKDVMTVIECKRGGDVFSDNYAKWPQTVGVEPEVMLFYVCTNYFSY